MFCVTFEYLRGLGLSIYRFNLHEIACSEQTAAAPPSQWFVHLDHRIYDKSPERDI